MQVKNYYSLSLEEIEKSLNEIRMWLFSYPTHEQRPRADFAFRVALSAKELQKDEWIQLVIDTIC